MSCDLFIVACRDASVFKEQVRKCISSRTMKWESKIHSNTQLHHSFITIITPICTFYLTILLKFYISRMTKMIEHDLKIKGTILTVFSGIYTRNVEVKNPSH